ncbi:potassium-transporting ATPase subunit KdpA [Arsenicicoccus cauae]|uniref:potassium-transporting ATPase subunit KdpA n=1 Tax=Arsenicicoccus cauae TaxID=2663847 RepID=UPI0025980807|nr:potassium-transporting ATPase subunit KdpA [uncultured Arsenicicoccus sp.]
MGDLLTVLALVALLAIVHVPLGTWMARVYTSTRHLWVERVLYRAAGVNPDGEQTWRSYALSVMGFSVASVLGLWALITAQRWLPLRAGREGMSWHTGLNTAVSFTTNTNWQSYAGEVGTGHLVQMAGLTVQNFVSAAVGMAVAVALVRGLARERTWRLGSLWVDLVRGTVRILLPIAVLGALVLIAGGVVQNLASPTEITTVTGARQTVQGGPVASQEVIKLLGTNGGGFFNANSAHPFENPNAFTNLVEAFLVLCIPFSLPWTYGMLVRDRRQGHVVLVLMASLWSLGLAAAYAAERAAATGATGALEGKEMRFGLIGSVLFGTATTGTSTGAVNSMHDSYSALGGGMLMLNMMLGEVSPGGVGTGLYSALILAIITVFIAGLMVGRTPEILGKQIGRREITCAALYVIAMPALVLAGTAIALSVPVSRDALLNVGPHGLSEMLYAFTSASNNNGSAFAGLSADQPLLNLMLAACMFLGRFVPIVLALALAGSLAEQRRRPVTDGTMPTHTPVFAGLLVAITIVLAGLTFFPSLALGPLAEALS